MIEHVVIDGEVGPDCDVDQIERVGLKRGHEIVVDVSACGPEDSSTQGDAKAIHRHLRSIRSGLPTPVSTTITADQQDRECRQNQDRFYIFHSFHFTCLPSPGWGLALAPVAHHTEYLPRYITIHNAQRHIKMASQYRHLPRVACDLLCVSECEFASYRP